MEFPSIINLNNPFSFKVCCVVFFIFIQILIENYVNSGDLVKTRQNGTSDLSLPTSHKKVARLTWVNHIEHYNFRNAMYL